MKRYFIVLFSVLIILFANNSMGSNGVILPELQITGKYLKDYVPFPGNNINVTKYPAQLVIDSDNGKIVGIKALYDKSVSFSEVEFSINNIYGDWQFSKNEEPQISLWRVTAKKIAISLSIDDNGLAMLIVLPFKDLQKK